MPKAVKTSITTSDIRYVGVAAAAQMYSLHPRTVSDAIRCRELPALREGTRGVYRISVAELDKWFRKRWTPA